MNKKELNKLNKLIEKSSIDTPSITQIPLKNIQPGTYQPRQIFEEKYLQSLALSIEEEGLLNPIVVRLIAENLYEIIGGERRFRAFKLLGKESIPCIIVERKEASTAVMAIIDNLHRKNLSVVDKALAVKSLLENAEWTLEDVLNKLDITEKDYKNYLKILQLPEDILNLLQKYNLSEQIVNYILLVSEECRLSFTKAVAYNDMSSKEANLLYENWKKRRTVTYLNNFIPIEPLNTNINKILGNRNVFISVVKTISGSVNIVMKFKDHNSVTDLIEKIRERKVTL